ncbi:MAG: DUF4124 domain-containing protein [Gammaproteobacteria bacterium]|nr:DUF4124 domain-containing protein [Gammaproteobacteria bacterium]
MHRTIQTIGLSLISLLLIAGSMDLCARTYRWTDADGKVHYSDRLPAEHIKGARSHLDKRGLETRRIEAAKTKEELARAAELKRLREEKERLIAEQREKDLVLVRTFRSEDDILMARDGKLVSINTSIQIDRTNIHRLKLKLANMQKNAANTERQGKKISKNYLRDIENTRKTLKDAHANIIRKEQHKESIRQKYGADLQRFRELKNLREPRESLSSSFKDTRGSLLDTVVICDDESHCAALWAKAESYVRRHATTRLQLLAPSIIMTSAPAKDDDITIAVSRIVEPKVPGARLFLDLQCKASPRGKDFCTTAEVEQIRTGFREFLSAAKPGLTSSPPQ